MTTVWKTNHLQNLNQISVILLLGILFIITQHIVQVLAWRRTGNKQIPESVMPLFAGASRNASSDTSAFNTLFEIVS